eukprot:405566-Pyramimonas_sp.AAC.1
MPPPPQPSHLLGQAVDDEPRHRRTHAPQELGETETAWVYSEQAGRQAKLLGAGPVAMCAAATRS